MKELFITRHAKSSWDYPYLNDYDRPLNDRGKRDAPKMAQWLSLQANNADLIITSGAERAKNTALALQTVFNAPMKIDDQLYHASRSKLLNIIKKTDNNINFLLLVSHNPGLNDLADYLLSGFPDNIPTGGIVSLKLNIEKWSEVSPKNASLEFFQYPKNL
ncbi:phosphohistidine phosphatase [Marivirga tractuosa]|uniref:Phosphohistidine phosphatase, SixA n=1 Tax=Marivirga tractuosa (strain ATCC 23168 / DSM 4126 / NBRC 15989 / NCIMB 1408 / VKM B-1430 / H-43) TaxID=643867 RepID=E4TVN9_MARTH|nr:histidine phosphatase family protein [Marivirga tractuosa]ADR21152.1 putative phosphohistidine phosphatase, SixA [Marivirga tractuosa DSM 4126]BDD14394.1 phosphohistidine phosphatase [Marivirga tractuosa]